MRRTLGIVCFVCVLAAVPAAADTIVDYNAAGWYADQTRTTDRPGSNNYFAGQFNSVTWDNFFNFDLSGLSGTVTSATITITNRQSLDLPAVSPNDSDTYTLFNANASASDLASGAATPLIVGGTTYGSYTTDFNTLPDGFQVVITLDAAAVSAINSLIGSGTFTAAGTVTTAPANISVNDYLFVGAGDGLTEPLSGDVFLTLSGPESTTPEPASFVLAGSALAGVAMLRRRRTAA